MAVLSAAALLPNHASAFWPFSTNADAATPTLVPSSSTPTLRAPLNSNPNASAPIALATSGGSALVSYNGPGGTIAETAYYDVPPDRISVYEVKKNDTLSDIAKIFHVSVNTIIWANNLKSALDVHPKDILIILPVSGVKYTVVEGDTLKSIAKEYNADATEIAQYNGLDPAVPLKVGSTIIIPGGEISAPAPASTRILTRTTSTSNTSGGCGGPAQNGYYSNPLPGGRLTQGIHGCNGVDIGAARGTPIYAAADGTVIIARNSGWNGGYGNYVVITHENGSQTLYSHMKNVIASPGQPVYGGKTIIGYVGMTGITTGAHLHFEVRGAANPFRNCRVGSVCSPQ